MIYDSLPILYINLNHIVNNYRFFKNHLTCENVAAVVKADGYGIGMIEVATALYMYEECNNFFVASIVEGIKLRQHLKADNINIYVLSGIYVNEEHEFITYNLIPVINDWHQLKLWKEASIKFNQKLSLIIHIDTGMNRLGFNISDCSKLANFDYSSLKIVYVMSHLASADEKDSLQNSLQLSKFQNITNHFQNNKFSLINSPGSFLSSDYHFHLARIGKGLYGPNHTQGVYDKELTRAISLMAPILQIRMIDDDDTIGYNSTYKINKGARIATLALGYADGYLRSFSNRAKVFFKGYYLPLIGRVSMDYITIDISHLPENFMNIGDNVEIFGENISYESQFIYSSTSTYELFTRLSGRIQKKYHTEINLIKAKNDINNTKIG